MNRLSAATVKNAAKPGLLADGGGLYLLVSDAGTKSWIYRFMLNGKRRDMGLGPVHTISLADARLKAGEARRQALDGIDPIAARDRERLERQLAQAKEVTFGAAAEQWLDAHRKSWSNKKHIYKVEMHLRDVAGPKLGKLPVQLIDTDQVMKVLKPIWTEKPETASRVRGRIEQVLDYAKVSGYRTGDNPARWKGHLDQLLPSLAKIHTVRHMPSLPYPRLPAFMTALAGMEGESARALEFVILTASRTSETLKATWREVDLDDAHWTVPAERMKAGKEHRVPLSPTVLSLLKRIRPMGAKPGDFLFKGGQSGKPLSNTSMLMLMRRMKETTITTHGFRATFKTWAGEKTNHSNEVIEIALAHLVGDKSEQAYWRGQMFERRRALMVDWAAYALQLPSPAPDAPAPS